jgi:hypothetical protein
MLQGLVLSMTKSPRTVFGGLRLDKFQTINFVANTGVSMWNRFVVNHLNGMVNQSYAKR